MAQAILRTLASLVTSPIDSFIYLTLSAASSECLLPLRVQSGGRAAAATGGCVLNSVTVAVHSWRRHHGGFVDQFGQAELVRADFVRSVPQPGSHSMDAHCHHWRNWIHHGQRNNRRTAANNTATHAHCCRFRSAVLLPFFSLLMQLYLYLFFLRRKFNHYSAAIAQLPRSGS